MTTAMPHAAGRPALRLLPGGHRPLRVGVLGGGIAGLAAAYLLAKRGHRPVVLEASRQPGGAGAQFEHLGVGIDPWGRVISQTDTELLALIGELGLAGELHWSRTHSGVLIDGRLHGLDGPLDLLRFKALSRPDRLRAGVAALYAAGRRHGGDLDLVRAVDWLPRLFGARVFGRLWAPLLRARFGDGWSDVPAYWAWNVLRRSQDGAYQAKGCLRGGYRSLASALHAAVTRRGGQVRLGCPVESVAEAGDGIVVTTAAGGERYDAVVSTLAPGLLERLARGELAGVVSATDQGHRAVVNAVVVSRRRLSPYYATFVIDDELPFQEIVETTHVIPPAWVGGRHLCYVVERCDAGSEAHLRSDDIVAGQAVEGLTALYPHFRRRDVEAVYVFRKSQAEPVWTVGSLRERPTPRVARSRLYVCSSAQAYPRVPGWSTSVALAADAVGSVLDDLARTSAAG